MLTLAGLVHTGEDQDLSALLLYILNYADEFLAEGSIA